MMMNTSRKTNIRDIRTVRATALLLAVVVMAGLLAAVPAKADGWGHGARHHGSLPQLPYPGSPAYMNPPYVYNDYVKPQCGPGYEYKVVRSMNGKQHLYRPDEMTKADIYFTVGDWAYVGFGYSDGKWRHGFFRRDVFSPYDGWTTVPEISLAGMRYGTVTQDTIPYNGPSRGSGDYTSCKLYSGDEVCACMESNGWYLCRFYNNHSNNYGYVYLWVPGSSISWY